MSWVFHDCIGTGKVICTTGNVVPGTQEFTWSLARHVRQQIPVISTVHLHGTPWLLPKDLQCEYRWGCQGLNNSTGFFQWGDKHSVVVNTTIYPCFYEFSE